MGTFSKIKKYNKPSVEIDEKVELLNQELKKTNVITEQPANSTSQLYSRVLTIPGVPYEPAVYTDVPDTSGIREPSSFTQATQGGDPDDNSTWATGWSNCDQLFNSNTLNAVSNRPIVKSPAWDATETPNTAGIFRYSGTSRAAWYYINRETNTLTQLNFNNAGSDPQVNSYLEYVDNADGNGLPAWDGTGNGWIQWKHWWPYSLWNPRTDFDWDTYGGVKRIDDDGNYWVLLSTWMFVGTDGTVPGGWGTYKSADQEPGTFTRTTVISQHSIDDADYYPGNPDKTVASFYNVGDTGFRWLKDKATPPAITADTWETEWQPSYDYTTDDSGTKNPYLVQFGKVQDDHDKAVDAAVKAGEPVDTTSYVNQLNDLLTKADDWNTKNQIKNEKETSKQEKDKYMPPGENDPWSLDSLVDKGIVGTDIAWGKPQGPPTTQFKGLKGNRANLDAQKAASGMYPNMTPEKFTEKYGISPQEYMNLPQDLSQVDSDIKMASAGNFMKDIVNAGPAEIYRTLSDYKTLPPEGKAEIPDYDNIINKLETAFKLAGGDTKLAGNYTAPGATRQLQPDGTYGYPKEGDKVNTGGTKGKEFIFKGGKWFPLASGDDTNQWARAASGGELGKVAGFGDALKGAFGLGPEADRKAKERSRKAVQKLRGKKRIGSSGYDLDAILNQGDEVKGNVISEKKDPLRGKEKWFNKKDIAPEYPKKRPPKMVGGKWHPQLVPAKLPPSKPFIKISKKDLLRNHALKREEIEEVTSTVDAINILLDEHPEYLTYAQTRYPKSDPRLAELNYKMDMQLGASQDYIDTHFPENTRLLKRIQKATKKAITLTDPKTYKKNSKYLPFEDTGKLLTVNDLKKVKRPKRKVKVKRNKKSVGRFFKKEQPKTNEQLRDEKILQLEIDMRKLLTDA